MTPTAIATIRFAHKGRPGVATLSPDGDWYVEGDAAYLAEGLDLLYSPKGDSPGDGPFGRRKAILAAGYLGGVAEFAPSPPSVDGEVY